MPERDAILPHTYSADRTGPEDNMDIEIPEKLDINGNFQATFDEDFYQMAKCTILEDEGEDEDSVPLVMMQTDSSDSESELRPQKYSKASTNAFPSVNRLPKPENLFKSLVPSTRLRTR